MYYGPRPSTCNRCGHKDEVSVHCNPTGVMIGGWPMCQKCFEAFLLKHCGQMIDDADSAGVDSFPK